MLCICGVKEPFCTTSPALGMESGKNPGSDVVQTGFCIGKMHNFSQDDHIEKAGRVDRGELIFTVS